MSQKLTKLVTLLKELFQLDQLDLDFGLYRIMHAKAREITQFLENDLLPQVQAAFGEYKSADKAELEKELTKVVAGVEAAGMNPDDSPKVQELRSRYKAESVDLAGLESEVYDHLYSFFRRYYHEGDFLSKRVYKQGVYAIPYEGEEVKLHWANRDQYYIKTSEYLRDYAFRLRPEDEAKPMRVHFKLIDASEGEHGNVKATEGKDRVFILGPAGDSGHDFLTLENDELLIAFEYRQATMEDWSAEAKASATAAAQKKPPVQAVLLDQAAKAIAAVTATDFRGWIAELNRLHVKTNGERADYSRLEAHLQRYAARNTFDYFIHKDLGGFLRRELDFYIKNEVMHLDDIEHETAPRVEQYLSKIKVIRAIAGKLIAFLAQLEDFQKKLWLKKKFVVETNYCITLDRIPEEFYPEIAANEAQREEWVKLFAIDKIEASTVSPAYSEPLTVEFLKANDRLVLDSKHFLSDFKERFVSSSEALNDDIDGRLIHSENLQALRLLKSSFKEKIKSIYIDPPYNTGGDGFVYKDDYQESSWLSLLYDRVSLSRDFLLGSGTFSTSIDIKELSNCIYTLDEVFGQNSRKSNITIKRGSVTGAKVINPGPINISENVLIYSSGKEKWVPERAYRVTDYDSRYGTFLINPDDHHERWEFTTVLEKFADIVGVQKSKLRKHFGEAYEAKLLEFVIENAKHIVRFAGLDEKSVSQDAVAVKKQSISEPERIFYYPREDANDYYIRDGQVILFYKHRLQQIGQQLAPAQPISDIWDDVLPNDLHKEGGVSLKKGKKPEKLIHRIFESSAKKGDFVLDFFCGKWNKWSSRAEVRIKVDQY